MIPALTCSPGEKHWRSGALLSFLWVCFLIRGFFYSSVLPLWEGYDEWSHYAYIEHLLQHNSIPAPSETRVSREVGESLKLAPLPWTSRHLPPPHMVHDGFWQAAGEERQQRRARLLSLPPEWRGEQSADAPVLYEAQQPPLYYWLLRWPLALSGNISLPSRVYLLRFVSVVIASLVIPLGFLFMRRVFGRDDRALPATAIIAALPELMIDIGRVANESLAAVIYSTLLLMLAKSADETPEIRRGVLIGVILGSGLLTKAYFLTAVPAIALYFAWLAWRTPERRGRLLVQLLPAILSAAAVSGWWYHRIRALTGSWWGEQQAATLRNVPLLDLLRESAGVDWRTAADSAFLSHIWFGAWSFLQLRSWMYHTFRYLALLALLGLILLFVRSMRRTGRGAPAAVDAESLLPAFSLYAFFLLGMAYHVLVTFAANAVSATTGWYVYSLVVAEVALAAAGWLSLSPRPLRPWILPGSMLLVVLTDLYGMHFLLIPYHSGIIRHNAGGALETLPVGRLWDFGIRETSARLAVNKPPWLSQEALVVAWGLYLAATAGLMLIAIVSGRRKAAEG